MPLWAESIQTQISSASDDAEERIKSGEIGINSSDLELIEDHESQIVGLRFQNIAIPKGATITKAYIQFTVDEKNSEPTTLNIATELNANPLTFSYNNQDISSRITSSPITWNAIPAWSILHEQGQAQQTPNLSDIIQEVINLEEWHSGNALAFIISGTGKRVAKSYNGKKSSAPILSITYQMDETNNTQEENSIIPTPAGTLERRILSSSDDAEESNGNIDTLSSDLELIQDKTKHQTVGLRFTNIDIPKNTHISKSYIQFSTDESSSESTNLTIHAEKIANATTFLAQKYNISKRATTQAFTTWSPKPWKILRAHGIDQRSSDLSDLLQEVINQNGWHTGNAITFLISGEGKRVAKSYNGNPSFAPLLHIEYGKNDEEQVEIDNGDTEPNTPPIVIPNNDKNIYVSSTEELKNAINTVPDGSTIVLKPGRYQLLEDMLITQNNLTITSLYDQTGEQHYIDSTIIQGRGDYENRMFDASREDDLGANLKFIGLTIQDGGKFVTFTKGNDNLVSHCKISKIQRDIVSFDSIAGGKVLYCELLKSGDDAIDVDTKSIGNFEFAYNQIINSGDDGIEIHLYHHINYSSPLMHYNIHHNSFTNSGCDGIQLIDYDEKTNRTFSITHNHFTNNGYVAVGAIYKQSTHKQFIGTNLLEFVEIAYNDFHGGQYHILGGDNMYVTQNSFEDASVVAIKRVKDESIIINNTFKGNKQNFSNSNN